MTRTVESMTNQEMMEIGDDLFRENMYDTNGKWVDAFTCEDIGVEYLREKMMEAVQARNVEPEVLHEHFAIIGTYLATWMVLKFGPTTEEIQDEFLRREEMRGTDD